VAVKAIPLELGDDVAVATGSLQSGLRECLSTFRDLSVAHVVRYESYWLEEPPYMPKEIRHFMGRGRAAATLQPTSPAAPSVTTTTAAAATVSPPPQATLPPLAVPAVSSSSSGGTEATARYDTPLARSTSALSFRFCDDHPAAHDTPWNRSDCLTPLEEPAESPLGESSCGFVWEPAGDRGPPGDSWATSPAAKCRGRGGGRGESSASFARYLGSIPTPSRCSWVVLLIEMELMGFPDGVSSASAASEERLTLRAWLQRVGRTFSAAADVFGPLMLSVRHIHRKRLVHADLKPDNIFCVLVRGRLAAVRIGDFGLAGENQLFRQECYGVVRKQLAPGGTPGYAAPEQMRPESERGSEACPCSDKADIFACAVILLELLMPPFGTQMERIEALESFHNQKVVPDYVAKKLPKTRVLLLDMGSTDPSTRPSAEEVCKRFEKEVRKELCRSSSQQCRSLHTGAQAQQSTTEPVEAVVEPCRRKRKGRRR